MADFQTLPVDTGEGPYHFNRFRITFQLPAGSTKEICSQDFVNQFPRYFNSEFANVERVPERSFDGKPVLKFHGFSRIAGVDVAAAHHDWVVQFGINPNFGFTVQTLERTFRLAEDAAMAAEGVVAGGVVAGGLGAKVGGGLGAAVGGAIGAVIGGGPAYHANFRHFLAGRRAWRLDDASVFGVSGGFAVLETTAIERFSCEFYRLADKVQNLQDKVPPIWNTMLTNYATFKGLSVAPAATPPGWRRGGGNLTTDFVVKRFDTLEELKKDREYQAAIRVYPYLLPAELLS